jgi:hypothetical protein
MRQGSVRFQEKKQSDAAHAKKFQTRQESVRFQEKKSDEARISQMQHTQQTRGREGLTMAG